MANTKLPLARMGRNIRERMNELGLTDYQLSHQTGFPVTTIKTWMRGEAFPKGEKLDRLARALKTQPINIVAGKFDHEQSSRSSRST